MTNWVRSPSSEPAEFGIGDAPSPGSRPREEPSARALEHKEPGEAAGPRQKLYPDVFPANIPGSSANPGGFASLSGNLPSSYRKEVEQGPVKQAESLSRGAGPRLKEELKGKSLPKGDSKVEIDGNWFHAPSAPPFMLDREDAHSGGPSGRTDSRAKDLRSSEHKDGSGGEFVQVSEQVASRDRGNTPSAVKFDFAGGRGSHHRSRPLAGGGSGDRGGVSRVPDTAVARRDDHEKARAHYRDELASREQEELLTERQRQLMRRRPPPPPPEEDDASENALDTLLERVKVQWYPREVWAKMRFEDDYENLWGFNFDLVNRSAKLTLRKSRKPWWRASYSVQDMNLVVLTKKLPIPFVGAKMGKHVPAGMQPHLQFGFGYDFSNHTKGFRWAVTTPMQTSEGRRGNKEKWNVMNSPLDVGLKWSADVSLPELSGSMGTAEPRLSSDLGNYFFSIDKMHVTFTKRV